MGGHTIDVILNHNSNEKFNNPKALAHGKALK